MTLDPDLDSRAIAAVVVQKVAVDTHANYSWAGMERAALPLEHLCVDPDHDQVPWLAWRSLRSLMPFLVNCAS